MGFHVDLREGRSFWNNVGVNMVIADHIHHASGASLALVKVSLSRWPPFGGVPTHRFVATLFMKDDITGPMPCAAGLDFDLLSETVTWQDGDADYKALKT